jgi:hypothetical protein
VNRSGIAFWHGPVECARRLSSKLHFFRDVLPKYVKSKSMN